MKKSIIVNTNNFILEQVMNEALAFSMVITKRNILFDTKKEAQEFIKNHRCASRCKTYPLNKKQLEAIEFLKEKNDNKYIERKIFFNLKWNYKEDNIKWQI